jgi:predicted nucleic acid-binding protein
MRLVLDACVLFPDGVRGVLLAYARQGGFTPLWSDRIVGEWARAAERRMGTGAAALAAAARMRDEFSGGVVTGWEALAEIPGLPDPADAHVIAAAMAGAAEGIVTFNTRDFPLRVMASAGLARLHPDTFLRAEWRPGGALDAALDLVAAGAETHDFRSWLKRAGLPRLAKARAA